MDDQIIYCSIDNGWFDFVSTVFIKPDIYAHLAACGHNLPTTAPMGNRDEIMSEADVEIEPEVSSEPEVQKETPKRRRWGRSLRN